MNTMTALGLLTAVSLIGAATTQPTEALIGRLIEQLGADRLEDQQAAEKALEEIGEPALPRLENARAIPDAAIRERADRLLARIRTRVAERGIAPALFSGRYEAASVSRILADLVHQTGNAIQEARGDLAGPPNERRLTLTFDKTPFWEALDRLTRSAGLRDDVEREPRQVLIRPGPRPDIPTCYDGPLRFQLQSLSACRDFLAGQGVLTAQVLMAWEPRLRPVAFAYWSRPDVAVDDRGASLVDPAGQGRRSQPAGESGTIAAPMVFHLAAPARGATKLARLEGRCQVRLAGRLTRFVFSPLDQAAGRSIGRDGVTVTVESVRASPPIWIVRVRFDYPEPGDEQESHRQWHAPQDIRLRERQTGAETPVNAGHNVTLRQAGTHGYECLWTGLPGAPADYDLICELPTLIVTREAVYRFADVPLP